RLEVENQFAADLILRSQLEQLKTPHERISSEGPKQEANPILFLGTSEGQNTVHEAMAELKKHAERQPNLSLLMRDNLALLENILNQTQTQTLSTTLGNQLQRMFELSALSENEVYAASLGEETEVSKYVGAFTTGRVESTSVSFGKQTVQVATPMQGHLFARNVQAIEMFGKNRQALPFTWYKGQVRPLLAEHRDFQEEVYSPLVKGGFNFFAPFLSAAEPFAQAHAAFKAVPSDLNRQKLIRVGIKIMKYQARQVEGKTGQVKVDAQAIYDQALERLFEFYRESKLVGDKITLGETLGKTTRGAEAKEIVVPVLSLGGTLACAWLWEKHGGEFTINDDLDQKLREKRLRNFRVESAA
ncbi:MAG: hypothetical protein HGA76_04415, partial [Candidatus Firestonebacteria bacterium]|nr:hypothetical protein [Candidatus Firestonebacteria bacterium]